MILMIKQCPTPAPCVPITIRTWCFCEPTLWIPEAKFMNFVWKMSFFAEELTSLSKPDGVTVEQTRIWIRRGSPAMCMKPMRVGETVKETNEENP